MDLLSVSSGQWIILIGSVVLIIVNWGCFASAVYICIKLWKIVMLMFPSVFNLNEIEVNFQSVSFSFKSDIGKCSEVALIKMK